jgi:hypothetical protein
VCPEFKSLIERKKGGAVLSLDNLNDKLLATRIMKTIHQTLPDLFSFLFRIIRNDNSRQGIMAKKKTIGFKLCTGGTFVLC